MPPARPQLDCWIQDQGCSWPPAVHHGGCCCPRCPGVLDGACMYTHGHQVHRRQERMVRWVKWGEYIAAAGSKASDCSEFAAAAVPPVRMLARFRIDRVDAANPRALTRTAYNPFSSNVHVLSVP